MVHTTYDSTNKIWSGKSTAPVLNPNISVGQAVLWTLMRNPNKYSQISDNNGIRLTNSQIRTKTIRAAQNLRKLGYENGVIIGIIAKNSHHLAPIVFAAMAIGCPINTLDPTFDEAELSHMFGKTKPKLIFCDADILDVVRDSLKITNLTPRIFTFGQSTSYSDCVDDLFADMNIDEAEHEFRPIQFKDGSTQIAAILCSSGTTGLVKGVCLSHASIIERAPTTFFNADDTFLIFSSIYWVSGLISFIASALGGCTRVITTEPFTPELFFHLVKEYKVNKLQCSPYHFALAVKSNSFPSSDFSSVKLIACTGGSVPSDLSNEMRKRMVNGDVYMNYGLSENGGAATFNFPIKDGSVGRLFDGTRAKIINDKGHNCGPNENGEVCIQVPYPFLGYFGDEKSTRNAFDSDGWILTGDIGHFDDDGYLWLDDRKKDILRHRGWHISPSEIENVLVKHPGIEQVCVVGVPDLILADLPTAVIVRSGNAVICEEEVTNLVSQQFSDFKKLRGGVYFVESLPMTPSGKIKRRVVTQMAIKLFNERHKSA